MALFKSGNPALSQHAFEGFNAIKEDAGVMTLQGTVNKTGILLLLVFASAAFTWNRFTNAYDFSDFTIYYAVGCIAGLIMAIVMAFKKEWSPMLAPAYALCQGLCLGGLSALMNSAYPGIVFQAILLTFGIAIGLLIIYKLKIIKPTENFKLIVASATAGIALFYLISWVLSFFHIQVPFIHDSSIGGIIFSLVVVVIAALNLVVDFDFIEQGAENRVPKYMEWYAAFGLLVTLIWLYIEILRLLAKSRSRD